MNSYMVFLQGDPAPLTVYRPQRTSDHQQYCSSGHFLALCGTRGSTLCGRLCNR